MQVLAEDETQVQSEAYMDEIAAKFRAGDGSKDWLDWEPQPVDSEEPSKPEKAMG